MGAIPFFILQIFQKQFNHTGTRRIDFFVVPTYKRKNKKTILACFLFYYKHKNLIRIPDEVFVF